MKNVYSAYVENGLNFFWQACIPKLSPQTRPEVFLIIFINIFFSMLNETKDGELHLGPNSFFIDLYQIFILRAHQSLCKSLAPFRIFSWVDSVQPIIKRSRRAKFNKPQKVADHLRKIPNLVFPSHVASASLRKSLRSIRHQNAYEPQKP